MTATTPPVAALVVASRGGSELERTLASLAWAASRHVLVAPGASRALAAGIRADLPAAGWVLVLREGEAATPALARAVPALVAGPPRGYRLPIEWTAFGSRLRPRPWPVRLACGVPRLRATLGGEVELAAAPVGRAPADALLVRRLPEPLEHAVLALDGEAAALALLAARAGARPALWRLPAAAVAGALPPLVARGDRRLGWGRWIAAVLAGYRGLLAATKLWERAQLGVVEPA